MLNPDYVYELMAKCVSGNASTEEQAEMKELLAHNEQLRTEYEQLQTLWRDVPDSFQDTPEPADNSDEKVARIFQLASVQHMLNEGERKVVSELPAGRRNVLSFRLLYAAITIGVVLIAVIFLTRPALFKNESQLAASGSLHEIVTTNGSKTRSILPDGSSIRLNSGSRLFYKSFNGKTREVWLEGEAFFDVVKNPRQPFIVHTDKYDVRVLGTSFNVRSYTGDSLFETTLLRGKVQINQVRGKQAKPIFLLPNQKFIGKKDRGLDRASFITNDKLVNDHPVIIKLDSVKSEKDLVETAWIYNRLEFRGDNFEELGKKMERWFNVTFHFENEKLKKIAFNGSFENETIDQALNDLKIASSSGFGYRINGNEIYITNQ